MSDRRVPRDPPAAPAPEATPRNPVADYDRLAEAFRRETGLMAPGKDVPAAMNISDEDEEERRRRWPEWLREREAAVLVAPASPPEPAPIQDGKWNAEFHARWHAAAPSEQTPAPDFAEFEKLVRELALRGFEQGCANAGPNEEYATARMRTDAARSALMAWARRALGAGGTP